MQDRIKNKKNPSSLLTTYYRLSTGLTILELVVVIGIMSLITAVVLANYPEFGGSISLGRVAREIALSVRQAQAYGLGVRELSGSVPYPAYGIYFSEPDEFILFADTDDNGLYDTDDICGSGDSECVERYELSSKEYISELCILTGGTGDCDQVVDNLNITFKRPEPEAYIRWSDTAPQLYNGALIRLVSRKYPDREQVIRVWITGQISVLGE